MEEEQRRLLMQKLFGDPSEEDQELDSVHESNHHRPNYSSGILRSQRKLLKKMRFKPSSLSSNFNRLLTALVDSRHKKVYKVKNCITDVDPEKEKAESQTIRANLVLSKRRKRVTRKSSKPVELLELSFGFLEDALDEEPQQTGKEARGSLKRKVIESDEESPPKKSTMTHRRMAIIYDSDEESPPKKCNNTGTMTHRRMAIVYDSDEESPPKKPTMTHRRMEIVYDSDEESPPKKPTMTHRRMAIVYDSDED